jgi:hypothetical protein
VYLVILPMSAILGCDTTLSGQSATCASNAAESVGARVAAMNATGLGVGRHMIFPQGRAQQGCTLAVLLEQQVVERT